MTTLIGIQGHDSRLGTPYALLAADTRVSHWRMGPLHDDKDKLIMPADERIALAQAGTDLRSLALSVERGLLGTPEWTGPCSSDAAPWDCTQGSHGEAECSAWEDLVSSMQAERRPDFLTALGATAGIYRSLIREPDSCSAARAMLSLGGATREMNDYLIPFGWCVEFIVGVQTPGSAGLARAGSEGLRAVQEWRVTEGSGCAHARMFLFGRQSSSLEEAVSLSLGALEAATSADPHTSPWAQFAILVPGKRIRLTDRYAAGYSPEGQSDAIRAYQDCLAVLR